MSIEMFVGWLSSSGLGLKLLTLWTQIDPDEHAAHGR